MDWAASIASAMARTVQSMWDTTPLRRPRQGTFPAPRIVIPSESTSPTTAQTFVVPISRPTTISVFSTRLFIARWPDAARSARVGTTFEQTKRSSLRLVGWVKGRRLRCATYPHDDAIGLRVVVQEHDARGDFSLLNLGEDAIGLLELSLGRRTPRGEGDPLAPGGRLSPGVLLAL